MSKHPRSKRQRTGPPAFGEASEADSPSAQNNIPSSSALSTRNISPITVPALTTLCARVFVANLVNLSKHERTWKPTRRRLKALPDALVPKIFAMLRASCPTVLNNPFIVAYFLRGPSVVLTNDLPDLKESTISAIPSTVPGSTLSQLELAGFDKFPDSRFASTLKPFTSLRVLVLRGCSKVGPKTIVAAAKCCPLLTVVNLSYTSVTPASLVPLALACSHLEVLKLAGIPNWTDATFAKFLAGVALYKDFKLQNLRTLKLRQTSLSDSSLHPLMSLCPSIRRLDLSFTLVLHPLLLFQSPNTVLLEKLSLTSTRVLSNDMLATISKLPQLKTLSLGALGERQGSSAAMGNASALTMNNDSLVRLTDILENFQHLESVSLVGNAKLGLTERVDGALLDFISRVGRKCKSLNLAGIQSLRSASLAGLVPDTAEQGPPQLCSLILNHTNVDDEAAPFISCCVSLGTLGVGSTKFTSAGLLPIIDACTKLEKLDLTSCRGVKVVDRRRFFEVSHYLRDIGLH
ncbi:hypothetical protein PILCRDRAFT_390629 [Piloderma croceum F 1598]|uniref:F-box domain-containing protein n=1 Tax=Piloderma croceum (strain F 1598) TaxID=765440 RepID=A0A0C3FY93_PILCF|nr:hypothetical protein PILCRDRAFT_390629 [Piloderma croceum F 1598]